MLFIGLSKIYLLMNYTKVKAVIFAKILVLKLQTQENDKSTLF